MFLRLLPIVAISLVAHFWFGWIWSVLGPVFGGWRKGSGGLAVGGIGLGIAWAAIVLIDYLIAPSQVVEMARVVGSLLGDLPGPVTFVITILMGGILGMAGGTVGSSLAALKGDGD